MPWRRMAKKRSMTALHSSGSIFAARAIEPFTSAKSTVTCFRSPSTGSGAGNDSVVARAPPHSLQKRWLARFAAPHFGQGASGAAQLPQKRAVSGFGSPHEAQSKAFTSLTERSSARSLRPTLKCHTPSIGWNHAGGRGRRRNRAAQPGAVQAGGRTPRRHRGGVAGEGSGPGRAAVQRRSGAGDAPGGEERRLVRRRGSLPGGVDGQRGGDSRGQGRR